MLSSYKKIYVLGALLFVVTAYFSQGFFHPDEHAQVLEFAALKLGLTEKVNLAWEFKSQMRPAIQPFMVFVVHRFFSVFGEVNPFTVDFALRLFSALLSFLSIHLLIRAFIDKIKGEKLKLTFVLLSFLLWFSIYNSVRFSSENLAGRVFIIAFALFVMWQNAKAKHYFAIGLLLGLSFLFRYQNMFLIAGFLAWMLFIQKNKFSNVLLIGLGILVMFGVGVLMDRWLYGEWVLSIWKYFEENILLDKMSGFGTAPWYYYIVHVFNVGIPPFSLLYIVPFVLLVFLRPKDILVWTIVPFVLVHCYIGHKELRFLFPLVGFVPLLAVQAGEIVNEKWPLLLQAKFFKFFTVLFWVYNSIFVALIAFKSADSMVPLYELVYNNYEKPTVLYYTYPNPYDRALEIHYYRRLNLRVQKIDSVQQMRLSADTLRLLATSRTEVQALVRDQNEEVYTSLPDWVKRFNVTGWADRTPIWKVYEISKVPKR